MHCGLRIMRQLKSFRLEKPNLPIKYMNLLRMLVPTVEKTYCLLKKYNMGLLAETGLRLAHVKLSLYVL